MGYFKELIKIDDSLLSDFFLNFEKNYSPGKKLFPFPEDSAGIPTIPRRLAIIDRIVYI